MEIKDKIAIVTGASEGIGLATAKFLFQNGAKVVLAARSLDKLQGAEKDIPESLAVKADMREEADIKNLISKTMEKFGRIDILVNNAGQGMYGPIEKADIKNWKEVMELNVFGVVRAMQETIPIMRKQGGGAIVNISSGVSKRYIPYLGAYASTKYALNAVSLTARQELEKDKIIVSVVYPRMTATKFGENSVGSRPDFTGRPGGLPQVDPPELVAEKIIEIIRSGEAEIEL